MVPKPRVVVVDGCRTPFAKAGTAYRDLTAIDLGRVCVRELVERSELDPRHVDLLAMGQVIPSPQAPNLAREVGLRAGLPASVPAHSVNRACASASQAVVDVASAILLGHAEVGIAGGAESLSDVPVLHSRALSRILVDASRAKTTAERMRVLARIRPADLKPRAPAIAEPSTGMTMGESAERMAKENGISRREQDAIAARSHRRLAAAIDAGHVGRETCEVLVPPRYEVAVVEDNLLRRDTDEEALARLRPVYDPRFGSVTAGNASPLTDGAAAVLLMREDRAKAEGYAPRARIRSWAVAAVDPSWQLLMGPGLAIPLALERAGIQLSDVDVIEMHEAFAAQVASNVQALESEAWARERLGRSKSVGRVDPEKLNVWGGSIAVGHPFGATGARITTTLANALVARDGHLGLLSVCAQGGMALAMVMER